MSAQKGIGRQVQLGIAKESTRGTSPASPSYYLAWAEGLLEEKYDNAVDIEAFGVIEDSVSMTRVKNWAESVLKMPLLDKSFPLFFLSLFGTDTPALHSGETVVYDHPMTVLQTPQHPTFSLYIHDILAGQDYSHANCVVKKMEIDYALKKFIDASVTIVGQKGVQISALTPSQVAENRFVPQYLTFKQASSLSGLNAASATQVKSLKLSIDQNVEDDEVLGSTSPRDFLGKELKVEGTVELIFNGESDFKTNALANTARALRIDVKNTDVTLGTAANPQITIDLAKVFFTEFSLPRKLKDLVYQTIKFKAVYSISDSQMIKVTSTNLVAAY